MSPASDACLRRSREVLSGGFTTGRTAPPCDMTVLEVLPASYRRLTASSARPSLEVSCGAQLYSVMHSALVQCRCPYRAKVSPTPLPHTHTHTQKNEAKGRSLLPHWSNEVVFTNTFTFPTGRLHKPTQYECSTCSSAVRSVGRSVESTALLPPAVPLVS